MKAPDHPVRVTHLITRLIVGGAQENTLATVLGLHGRSNYQVDLVAGEVDGNVQGSLEHLVHHIPGLFHREPHLVRPVAPYHDLRAYFRLKQRFLDTRPCIVHTHSGKAGIIGRLAAHAAGVPLVIHSIHGPSFGEFQGSVSNLIFRTAERRAGRITDHFIGVANAMCQQYQHAGIGHPGQYSTIHSGFDLRSFLESTASKHLRAKLGLSDDDFVVGKIARLFELKGHEALMNAMPDLVRQIPNIRFLWIGDGQDRVSFEQRLSKMGLRDRVVFTGLVAPHEVPELVGVMDCLIHLSLREGLPRALPQALAAGKPVVALNRDGAPEVCIEGQTGFLLQYGHPGEIASALFRLAESPALRQEMGEAGRRWVQERFSVKGMVDRIDQLYQELLIARRRGPAN